MAELMTIDKLVEICEREYKRGMATAKPYNFDFGYATAFKLCLSFAKELKNDSHPYDTKIIQEVK